MAKIVKNEGNKWWQLFKTGKHTTKAGKEFSADENTLQEIIDATKKREYAGGEVPIVLGHPKENAPQFGAFKNDGFKSDGKILSGLFDYLAPEFAECIEKKMYNKISIALYPDNAIRHVGFFGALQTSLKDLAPVELSLKDEDYSEIEFAEFEDYELSKWYFSDLATLIRNIKNFLVDKFSLEEVEKIIPEYGITNISQAPSIYKNEKNYFSEKNKDKDMSTKTVEQVTQEFSDKLNAAESDKKKLETDLAALKAKQLETEINLFCESDQVKKKITPALMPHVKQLLADLSADNTEFEFSEGEGDKAQTLKSTPVESFKKILSALPDAVEFSETATKEKAAGSAADPNVSEFSEMTVNEEAMELHKKALTIQAADKCSYAEAVRKANKQ